MLCPIHTADADATKLFCRVASASAVCFGHYVLLCGLRRPASRTESCITWSPDNVPLNLSILRNRRWGGCVYVLQMFFLHFSVHHKNLRQPFSGTAERIFMKLLSNDSGDNVVCIAAPKWGLGPRLIFGGLKTTHCALGGDAWRMNEKN